MKAKAAKVCLVGDFGVGKTSLVNRFVRQAFDERYQTTVGVTIETIEIDSSSAAPLKLIIWDIAGSDIIDTVKANYLRGAAGLLFVADGTRQDTLEAAINLQQQAQATVGTVPCVYMLNKRDLSDQWELSDDVVDKLRAEHPVFLSSARTGDEVEQAFHTLAKLLSETSSSP